MLDNTETEATGSSVSRWPVVLGDHWSADPDTHATPPVESLTVIVGADLDRHYLRRARPADWVFYYLVRRRPCALRHVVTGNNGSLRRVVPCCARRSDDLTSEPGLPEFARIAQIPAAGTVSVA
jgi:hypothetical protein